MAQSTDTNPRIYLLAPHLGEKELALVQQAMASNWIAPVGPQIDAFENTLQDHLGPDAHVTALQSGTAAIHLGLLSLGVKPGDEVLCQSLTFAGSAFPINYCGATPIFVDSESLTGNICPQALETAIKARIKRGTKPKAIIAVHLYGMPYQVREIHDIARHYDIAVLEDAAEALGSYYHEQPCGALGDQGVLSFNGNKILTTSGGGALVSRSIQEKQKALYWATQAKSPVEGFHHNEIGYNYRLSNICAAIGVGQMGLLKARLTQKQALHHWYEVLFEARQGISLQQAPDSRFASNWWLNVIVFDPRLARCTPEQLSIAFAEENIESRPLWRPMHLQPVYQDAPYYGGSVAQNLFEHRLCLPSSTKMSPTDRERIAAVIQRMC